MNEHLSEQLIERYRRRALSPAELLDVDDHMAACEMCRRRLGDEPRERATAKSLRADLGATGMTHLDYERLAAYVEGELDPIDREIIDSHLKLCDRCDFELNELRAFATRMASYPIKEYAPAAPSPLGEKAHGLWDGVRAFWRSPAFALPVRFAGLGLVIAVALWAASLKSRNSQLQTALDQQRRENEKLKQDFQAANASLNELQNQLAQLKSTQSSSPVVVALNDGGGRVTLDKEGKVAGVAAPFQRMVR